MLGAPRNDVFFDIWILSFELSLSMPYPLLLLCGPSGVGKTTVVKLLRQLRPDLKVGVTYTTRPARPEREDKDMRNISQDEFQRLLTADALVEHVEFAGHLYGTARAELETSREHGPVLLNLELVGCRQVKEKYPDAITIFLAPSSLEVLEKRIRERGDYDENDIVKRLARASADWSQAAWFEHQIVNPDGHPEVAAQALVACLRQAHLAD
jgi:guanylate kinase